MAVTLTPKLEDFVAAQMQSGYSRSAADVGTQSLELLRTPEEFIHSNSAALRDQVSIGLEQIRQGEVFVGKPVIRRLRWKLDGWERGD